MNYPTAALSYPAESLRIHAQLLVGTAPQSPVSGCSVPKALLNCDEVINSKGEGQSQTCFSELSLTRIRGGRCRAQGSVIPRAPPWVCSKAVKMGKPGCSPHRGTKGEVSTLWLPYMCPLLLLAVPSSGTPAWHRLYGDSIG